MVPPTLATELDYTARQLETVLALRVEGTVDEATIPLLARQVLQKMLQGPQPASLPRASEAIPVGDSKEEDASLHADRGREGVPASHGGDKGDTIDDEAKIDAWLLPWKEKRQAYVRQLQPPVPPPPPPPYMSVSASPRANASGGAANHASTSAAAPVSKPSSGSFR